MWRQNKFPGNPDSDQSISEEEEFENGDLGGNCVSLSGNTGKEEPLQLQSRLEMLRGAHELNCGRKTGTLSQEKQRSFSLEDEVEVPDSPNEGDFHNSARQPFTYISDDENSILPKFSMTPAAKLSYKDDLHSLQNAQRDGVYTWSTVTKEAEALTRLNDNSSCSSSHFTYSKANKSSKGVKGKVKPKFSFRFQSHKGISTKVHEMHEVLETIDDGIVDHSIAELLEDFHGKKENQSEIVPAEVEAVEHGCIEHSMTELLDGLQDNSSLLKGNSKMYIRRKGKRLQLAVKSSVSPLGDTTTDSEELPEPMDNGSSNDDEAGYQNIIQPIPEQKRQSIADRFLEALCATSLSNEGAIVTLPKPSGSGLLGKLQQVMESEKQRDMDFLKKFQIGGCPINEPSCMNVKILSRYLDGKLTVCQCTIHKNLEGSPWPDSPQTIMTGGKESTIIFNPKVCGNVDLEVGSLIRIHPPWKEVQVMSNDERIVLSTYFSEVLT